MLHYSALSYQLRDTVNLLDLSYSSSSCVRDINGFSSIAVVHIVRSAHREKTVWSILLLLQPFSLTTFTNRGQHAAQKFDRERAWADVTCWALFAHAEVISRDNAAGHVTLDTRLSLVFQRATLKN